MYLKIQLNVTSKNLKKERLMKRTHGGAIFEDFYGIDLLFGTREDNHREEKQRIGQKAAGLIQDGGRIILDAGTTVAQSAKILKISVP